jgi:hypothetical protein
MTVRHDNVAILNRAARNVSRPRSWHAAGRPVRLRFGAREREPIKVTIPVIGQTDIPASRVGSRRLDEPPILATDIVAWMPPRRDRRTAHVFQGAESSRQETLIGQVPCLLCGYAEAAHTALTGPEKQVVATLVNQRQAPEFMRRSILRKLADTLRIR